MFGPWQWDISQGIILNKVNVLLLYSVMDSDKHRGPALKKHWYPACLKVILTSLENLLCQSQMCLFSSTKHMGQKESVHCSTWYLLIGHSPVTSIFCPDVQLLTIWKWAQTILFFYFCFFTWICLQATIQSETYQGGGSHLRGVKMSGDHRKTIVSPKFCLKVKYFYVVLCMCAYEYMCVCVVVCVNLYRNER